MKKNICTIALSSTALFVAMSGTSSANLYEAGADYDVGGATDSQFNSHSVNAVDAQVASGNQNFDGGEGWGEGAAHSDPSLGIAAQSSIFVEYFEFDNQNTIEAGSSAHWVKEYTAPFDGNYAWNTSFPEAVLEGIVWELDAGGEIIDAWVGFDGFLNATGAAAPVTFTAIMTGDAPLFYDGLPAPTTNEPGLAVWSPFIFSTSLGHFYSGDTITIEYYVETDAFATGVEYRGEFFALFGDPQSRDPAYFLNGTLSGIEDPAQEPIPEPATMLLLGTGLVGVAGAARKKKKNQV